MTKPYIDLHLHSTYSLLDGMVKIDDAVKFCKDNDIKALSITDHGDISSWIKQYNACKKADIKPILASEFYMSLKEIAENPHNLTKDGKPKKMHTKHYHLNLFALSKTGYKNIIKLTSYANMNNFYSKPRITMDKLREYSEGIICTTACVGSIWGQLLKRGHVKLAERMTEIFLDIFGDRFYIEYGYHYFEDEKKVIPHLYHIAQKYNIKTIIGNDTHYLYKSEETAHKILMCKGDKQTLSSSSYFDYSHNYYKNMDEIKETFSEFPYINVEECNDNAYEIVERCNVEIKFGEYVFPKFATPNNETDDEYLIKLVKEGIKDKYPKLTKEIIDRVNYEIKVITEMKFSGYFLVVQDYINWCIKNNVMVGYGRGSAAGSIVVYILGITNVDPIKYNLLFERFLNPARVSFPDIDSDIESKKRPLVFEYLREKYGKYGFSHISTRGMLTAKSCIKMVASKLEYDFGKFNRITAQISDPAPKTIEEVFQLYPDVKKIANMDNQVKEVFDYVKILQGNVQSIGIHPGGQVICHEDITDYCPIIKTKDGYATGWTDKDVEKIGLIKFDILGLSNLSILENCLSKISEPIDLNTIPEDDKKSFDLLSRGEGDGIFQFESNSAKSLLKRAKPQSIDDLGVTNAANRPGALDSGLTESYIQRKNGLEDVDYIVDGMEEYLQDTNGLPIYQEQILFLFRVMAGFNLAEADLARRAVGKKQIDELMALKDKFVQGSLANGHSKEKAEEVFDIIDKFANYGFNKCIDGDYVLPELNTSLKNLHNNQNLYKNKTLTSYNADDNIYFKDALNNVHYTGNNHVFEIEFDNGEKLPVTMEHKFLCIDGKYHTIRNIFKNSLEMIGE